MRFLACAAILSLTCMGCSSAVQAPCDGDQVCRAGPSTAPRPPGGAALSPVDDLAKLRRCQAEAEKLLASNQAVKVPTLISQLNRTRCRLKLPQATSQPVSDREFYERFRPSVLLLGSLYKCDKCSRWHLATACAFPITTTGVCVTNYHVVNEPNHAIMVAMTADNRVLPVKEVLAASRDHDVAILQVEGQDLQPVPLVAGAPVGSHVRLISHPNNQFYTLTEGVVSRYFLGRRGGGTVPLMSITADFAKGSSGAPVFDDQGRVVGMVAATLPIYYIEDKDRHDDLQMVVKRCVPAESILKLIDQ
jgi:serine protease Do